MKWARRTGRPNRGCQMLERAGAPEQRWRYHDSLADVSVGPTTQVQDTILRNSVGWGVVRPKAARI